MLFVNTRPSDRAAALSAALSQQGIPVFELPLLELQACDYTTELDVLYQQLSTAAVIVVVSPSAVEIGMQYLQQSGLSIADLQHIQWVAVGIKTAQVLANYGVDARVPEVETSEGMLQLPYLQDLPKLSTIAFWRGEGGRQFMMQQLENAGMQILNFVLYQRQCPQIAIDLVVTLVEKLQQPQCYTVLISSEASWHNWHKLFRQYKHVIEQAQYMVLGARLAAVLLNNPYDMQLNINQLNDLSVDTIIAKLALDEGQA